MSTEREVPLVYVAIAELGLAAGAAPLTQFPACWEYQVDKHWRVAFNGHAAAKHCSFSDATIEPFTCYATFNGWAAFVIDPNGGFGAAGTVANEDSFLEAIRAETERLAPGSGRA